jgi:hypothetical protein
MGRPSATRIKSLAVTKMLTYQPIRASSFIGCGLNGASMQHTNTYASIGRCSVVSLLSPTGPGFALVYIPQASVGMVQLTTASVKGT